MRLGLLRLKAREAESARCVNVCLVDALRALGFKVPYARSGPFWAVEDGNAFLQPWQCLGLIWQFACK